jgi:quercetin dioxygenase-like cupin family protein
VPYAGVTVAEEPLFQKGTILVRRLRLAPGEAMPWHRDPFNRVTVVLSGDVLEVEYRDGGQSERFAVTPGQADWDEPTDRVHRGINVGEQPYEEIAVFMLDRPDAVPQPRADDV